MQRRVLRSWKRSTERIAMEKLTSTRKRAKTETRSKPPLTEMLLDKMLTRRMSERTDTRGKKKEKDGHEEANRFSWTRFQSFAALCIGALSTLGRPSPVMFDYPPPAPVSSRVLPLPLVPGRGVPMFAHTRSATRVLCSPPLPPSPYRRTNPSCPFTAFLLASFESVRVQGETFISAVLNNFRDDAARGKIAWVYMYKDGGISRNE